MEKLEHGREAAHAARTAIRLSLPYMEDGVKTITTDNGNGSSVHGKITEAMKEPPLVSPTPALRGRKMPL